MTYPYLSGLVKDKVFATDLSSIVFDQQSGHLIASKRRIEAADQDDRQGQGGELPLLCWPTGIPQPKAVTIYDGGHLYLISEPNLFYRLTHEELFSSGLFQAGISDRPDRKI